MWEFMHSNIIEIKDDITDVKDNRENDLSLKSIFEIGKNKQLITKNERRITNLCRKYLQLMTLSDIATGDRKYIALNVWKDDKKGNKLRNIAWTEQDKHKPYMWTVWRRVLKQCILSNQQLLMHPVGRWLVPMQDTACHWE